MTVEESEWLLARTPSQSRADRPIRPPRRDASMAAGEDARTPRSAVVSTAGTWASRPCAVRAEVEIRRRSCSRSIAVARIQASSYPEPVVADLTGLDSPRRKAGTGEGRATRTNHPADAFCQRKSRSSAVLTRFFDENRVFRLKIAFIRRANAFFRRKSRFSPENRVHPSCLRVFRPKIAFVD